RSCQMSVQFRMLVASRLDEFCKVVGFPPGRLFRVSPVSPAIDLEHGLVERDIDSRLASDNLNSDEARRFPGRVVLRKSSGHSGRRDSWHGLEPRYSHDLVSGSMSHQITSTLPPITRICRDR